MHSLGPYDVYSLVKQTISTQCVNCCKKLHRGCHGKAQEELLLHSREQRKSIEKREWHLKQRYKGPIGDNKAKCAYGERRARGEQCPRRQSKGLAGSCHVPMWNSWLVKRRLKSGHKRNEKGNRGQTHHQRPYISSNGVWTSFIPSETVY